MQHLYTVTLNFMTKKIIFLCTWAIFIYRSAYDLLGSCRLNLDQLTAASILCASQSVGLLGIWRESKGKHRQEILWYKRKPKKDEEKRGRVGECAKEKGKWIKGRKGVRGNMSCLPMTCQVITKFLAA